ncbi:MAG TPA: hypothetical protein PKA27_17305 [Fimbriimonadaceae bacterium]|nr:hypothetical protein [Fimbriimonadaceae bacterium]
MLQQTQVATGLPYWLRWMERFPTIESLASATEDEVLAHWQGLGYYRRARNLHEAAQKIISQGWPKSAKEWRQLPGIGDYTSGALASITLDEPVPAVDGNVERVFARVERCRLTGGKLSAEAKVWALGLVPNDQPGDWNQAMMELGARVCRPRFAECDVCPLSPDCQSSHQADRHEYPVRIKSTKTQQVERHHAVFVSEGAIALARIEPGAWWEGMWEFPEVAAPMGPVIARERHQVTHHRIVSHAYVVSDQPTGSRMFELAQVAELAMPAAQRRLLNSVLSELK